MFIAKFLPFAMAASVMAAPSLIRRDLATIQAAFSEISTAVAALDAGVGALTPETDPQSAIDSLTKLSNDVVATLQTQTTAVAGTSALSLTDSLSLLSSSSALVNAVSGTVDELISKKSIVDAANAASLVLEQLNAQKTASQAFIAAVVSKVPSSVSGIANQQAQQVVTALEKGIAAYS